MRACTLSASNAALLWLAKGLASVHSFIYSVNIGCVPAVPGSGDTKKRQKSPPPHNLHLEGGGRGKRCRETSEEAV